MAKVTPVKWGIGQRDMGEFHCESYNLFDEEDRGRYEDLRTSASNAANGIVIENMREYARKTVTREGEGADSTVTTTEDIILVIQYWQKPPEKDENTEEEKDEARRGWRDNTATG